MAVDLHKGEFDEATVAKLDLFRSYLREWLPVVLFAPGDCAINVFDFFAGPGQSVIGQPGSPLLILEELRLYGGPASGKNVHLYFNEMDPKKLAKLKALIGSYKFAIPAEIHFKGLEFSEAFKLWCPRMRGARNLLFLDQSGVRQITKDLFRSLVELAFTDFLFFVASSSLRRFGGHPSFKKYLETEKIDPTAPYHDIHRAVVSYYKGLIPDGKEYYLAGFTLKKGSNVYGLVFGTRHPLGMHKFLGRCWKLDEERGEANFDIDDDGIQKDRPFLFPAMNSSTKLERFESELRSAILAGRCWTDRAITLFAVENGFVGRHARKVVSQLRAEGLVTGKNLAFSEACFKPGREPQPLALIDRAQRTSG